MGRIFGALVSLVASSSPTGAPERSGAPSSTQALLTSDEQRAYCDLKQRLNLRGDSYYAECRLDGTQQLDLLVAFHRSSASLFELEAQLKGSGSPLSRGASTAWSAARDFTSEWLDPDSALRAAVSTVWFEFDDVMHSPDEVGPSLSACLVDGYGVRFAPEPEPEPDRDAEASRMALVYRALAGVRSRASEEARLCRALEALPRHGKLIHLSLMSARAAEAVKVYGVVPRDELVSYLRRLGWSGAYEALAPVLSQLACEGLCGGCLYFDLNLSTLESRGEASLGIAFSQQQLRSCGGDPGRRELFERLIGSNRISASRALVAERWPSAEAANLALGQPQGGHRWLDVKLVIRPSGLIRSKAYFGFSSWRSPFG